MRVKLGFKVLIIQTEHDLKNVDFDLLISFFFIFFQDAKVFPPWLLHKVAIFNVVFFFFFRSLLPLIFVLAFLLFTLPDE